MVTIKLVLKHISLLLYFSVFFMFGLIMAVAGVAGLTLGSGLSYWLRPKYRGVDPLICGGGRVLCRILGGWFALGRAIRRLAGWVNSCLGH